MNAKKISLGETKFGKGPYTIEDITTNAALLIRAPKKTNYIAAVNFDPLDAPRAYDAVADIISTYLSRSSIEEPLTITDLEAIVVGGEFREHILKEEKGIHVYIHHNITHKMLVDALEVTGIRISYIKTDPRATKKIRINIRGECEKPYEEIIGLNQNEAVMSLDSYHMTIGKYED